jgi:hypothetical protein
MKPSRTFLLLPLLFISSASTFAQQKFRNAVEVVFQPVLTQFTANSKLIGSPYGGEIILHLNRENSTTPWMRAIHLRNLDLVYNYQRMNDVQLDYYPFNGIFGDSHALLAGIEIGLFKFKKIDFILSPAVGLAYVDKTYFVNRNPVISSHVNVALRAKVKVAVPITETVTVSGSLSAFHYSNGAYRVANNGMNLISAGLGISKNIGTAISAKEEIGSTADQRGAHQIDVGLDMGRRGIFRSKKGIFRTGATVSYRYHVGTLLALNAGIDGVYYHTIFDPDNYQLTHQSYGSSYDRLRVGAAVGPDLWMGKLAAMFRYGYYLHYNSLTGNKTYWTAGLRYTLNGWASLQSKIYLHGTEADYLGFGLIFSKKISN